MARITFVLPELSLSGGIRVVGQYTQELLLLGHTVSVITRKPPSPRLRDLLRGRVRPDFAPEVIESYFAGNNALIGFVPGNRSIKVSDLPDADFLIATWWETVEWVSAMPASKGRLVHLMQGYEMFPWLPLERVAATYEMDTLKIAISNWVARQVFDHHGRSAAAIIHNAVDAKHFAFKLDRDNTVLTLGFVYAREDIKNSIMAFELQDMLAELGIPCELLAFHNSELPESLKKRAGLKSYHLPPQTLIPSLYQQCDLWLFLSLEEGFGLPILEALSCGTPVVASPAGAASELIISGENGYLCAPTAEAFADAVALFVALGDAKRHDMARRARETVTSWTWTDCARRLIDVLEHPPVEAAVETPPTTALSD